MRISFFCQTKQRVIFLSSLLLASLLLAACGENSASVPDSHGPIAGSAQTAQATASTISEFPIPTVKSGPANIVPGPDGNLWFTEQNGNKIGRITPKGTITEFPIPTVDTDPAGITSGPDRALWFTEASGDKIGRITPEGTITEFPIPTIDSWPLNIVRGTDDNLWFTENDANKIGRITTRGTITEFTLPKGVGLTTSHKVRTTGSGSLSTMAARLDASPPG